MMMKGILTGVKKIAAPRLAVHDKWNRSRVASALERKIEDRGRHEKRTKEEKTNSEVTGEPENFFLHKLRK